METEGVCKLCSNTVPLTQFIGCGQDPNLRWCDSCVTISRAYNRGTSVTSDRVSYGRDPQKIPISDDGQEVFVSPSVIEHVPTREDQIAYVAGVCDAEGSFGINNKGVAAIDVYNNNPKILEAVKSILGCGNATPDHRGTWHFRTAKQSSVLEVCTELLPFMVLKKRQVEILIQAVKSKNSERKKLIPELSELNAKMKQIDPPDKTEAAKVVLPEDTRVWAYFAGYVDGDATLVIQNQIHGGGRYSYFYVQLHVYGTKVVSLQYLRSFFGGMIDNRKRSEKQAHSLELSFEDQYYIQPILKGLRPYIVEKAEQFDVALEACKKKTTDRELECSKIKELNGKFRGLHKFDKLPDGTYVDGKRSKKKPHKTHYGKPLPPQKASDENLIELDNEEFQG